METFFRDLDKIINLNKGKLIVVGARPGVGKSMFALNIINNIAIKQNLSVLYFNLESSREKIVNMLISANTTIEYNKLLKLIEKDKEWSKMQTFVRKILDTKIYIDITPMISIDRICKKSRKLKMENDIKLIVIDYLQLINNNKNCWSRDNQIKNIMQELKKLAEELNIPILITSQISRNPETIENHRPIIEDIAESITEESDIVMFLYRDDYYYSDTENKNITEIIVAKNENGICHETVKLVNAFSHCKFGNTISQSNT